MATSNTYDSVRSAVETAEDKVSPLVKPDVEIAVADLLP